MTLLEIDRSKKKAIVIVKNHPLHKNKDQFFYSRKKKLKMTFLIVLLCNMEKERIICGFIVFVDIPEKWKGIIEESPNVRAKNKRKTEYFICASTKRLRWALCMELKNVHSLVG